MAIQDLLERFTSPITTLAHGLPTTEKYGMKSYGKTEFLNLTEREQSVRSLMAKMESGLIRRLARFHHD